MYPSILGSFVGFCTPLSACQPPFLLRGWEVVARGKWVLRVGGGWRWRLSGGLGERRVGWYGLRARGCGDFVAGRKLILRAFFGACARFWVMGGVDIPENLFCRCTPIKTAF